MEDYKSYEPYWMFFAGVDGFNDTCADRLLARFETAKGIYEADELSLIFMSQSVNERIINAIINRRKTVDPFEEYEKIGRRGIRFMSRFHPRFPERMRLIPNPPNGLFYKGSLPDSNTPAIAIVGSRACSNYGRDVALRFSEELARAGIDIISGMAAGVDGIAHRGALRAGGDTYALLGTGVDKCYPSANRDIYEEIPLHGGLISEYYPGTEGLALNFPKRNRLISGFSDGILVVEARERSGTWITVDMGLEQNKDIFAVPGRIDDPLSFGCNRIIRNGARLVMSPQDIIAELSSRYGFLVEREGQGDGKSKSKSLKLAPNEKKVYSFLSGRPYSAEEIIAHVKSSETEVLSALTMLEIKGLCENVGGGMYVRRTITK